MFWYPSLVTSEVIKTVYLFVTIKISWLLRTQNDECWIFFFILIVQRERETCSVNILSPTISARIYWTYYYITMSLIALLAVIPGNYSRLFYGRLAHPRVVLLIDRCHACIVWDQIRRHEFRVLRNSACKIVLNFTRISLIGANILTCHSWFIPDGAGEVSQIFFLTAKFYQITSLWRMKLCQI
jgi:hypothetical protein